MSEPCYTPQWPAMYLAQHNVPIRRALCHDGHLIIAKGTDRVRSRVIRHLQEIGFRPENFDRYLQSAICNAMPPGSRVCRYLDENAPAEVRAPRSLSLHDVVNFIGAVGRWFKSGDVATGDLAQARAQICLQCDLNQEIPGCSGCNDLMGRISRIVGDRRLPNDSSLKGCAACGCALRLKVWMPTDALKIDADYPAHCWLRREVQAR